MKLYIYFKGGIDITFFIPAKWNEKDVEKTGLCPVSFRGISQVWSEVPCSDPPIVTTFPSLKISITGKVWSWGVAGGERRDFNIPFGVSSVEVSETFLMKWSMVSYPAKWDTLHLVREAILSSEEGIVYREMYLSSSDISLLEQGNNRLFINDLYFRPPAPFGSLGYNTPGAEGYIPQIISKKNLNG